MTSTNLRCDGCGQLSSPDHIARRLRRLEWTTRFRPVHISVLLLGAVAPQSDSHFLYSPAGNWNGESGALLAAAGIKPGGKAPEAVLSEFQRGGLFLAHVLECSLEQGQESGLAQLVRDRLPFLYARIRRSLQPKRLALISASLEPFLPDLVSANLPCALVLDQGGPFALGHEYGGSDQVIQRLSSAITVPSSQTAGQ